MAWSTWRWPVLLCLLGACVFLALQQPVSASADHRAGVAPSTGVGLAEKPTPTLLAAEGEAGDEATEGEAGDEAKANWMRWLWWPCILYLFWGMGYICDVYFVRTIEVISERFDIPDDVAGATLMALGCNGPELSLNAISIFQPSSIGVGAVIGGEVFNVLVIIGTALLATPEIYMPLRLGAFSFLRDVTFYIISVGLLYWALQDGEVTRVNCLVMLAGAVAYSTTVVLSPKLRRLFSVGFYSYLKHKAKRVMRTISSASLSLPRDPTVDDLASTDSDLRLLDSEDGTPNGVDGELLRQWTLAGQCHDPCEGTVLGVRVDVRNRLMDRSHRVDKRYMWIREPNEWNAKGALLVSTGVDPKNHMKHDGKYANGIMYDYAEHMDQQHHWHHGGLVNEPVFKEKLNGEVSSPDPEDMSGRPLLNGTVGNRSRAQSQDAKALFPESFYSLDLADEPWEVIPLEDILYVEPPLSTDEHHGFSLHVHQHDSNLGNLITLEMFAWDEEVSLAWVKKLESSLLDLRRKSAAPPPRMSCASLMLEWLEWVQFPVKFFLKVTIPDMDNHRLQGWYPVSFVMSMVWLSFFAFSVITACDGIHRDFGISTEVLGFTIAAAGTSLPNVFSGMVVARQGKTTMAIANALGANVQNVFLALAIPWTIQSFMSPTGSFQLEVSSLAPAVLECAITLMPVVLVFFFCHHSLPKWSGWLFLSTYLVYLVFALGQEITHCGTWPLRCNGIGAGDQPGSIGLRRLSRLLG